MQGRYILGAAVFIIVAIGAIFMITKDKTDDSSANIAATEQIKADPAPAPMREENVPSDNRAFAQPKLSEVYFDYDKYGLRSDARSAVGSNIKWLKDNANAKIRLEGHCDERGTSEYNLVLGDRRASAVRRELVRRGVSTSRINTISHGKARPARPNANSESEHQLNRRVVFDVSG